VISRNKRTVTLNLSRKIGQMLEGLVLHADVVIENFRPGVMEKWALGPERVHELNPALVILRVTSFGQFGPYACRKAFGTLAEAMTGFAHQTGQPTARRRSRPSASPMASPASRGRSPSYSPCITARTTAGMAR
jgi:crotonobetainyl-CoA:carnitine CoA-transferase CaiB-like acyl-CoA transferase